MKTEIFLKGIGRTATILSTVWMIILLSGCSDGRSFSDEGDSWAEVLENGHGTLKALYVPAEGFAYRDEEGRLTGVTVELIRGLADFVHEQHGARLEVQFEKEEDWGLFYRRMVRGGDGLIGFGNVTITEERKNELIFSPPYMSNIASLISYQDVPDLQGFDEMASTFEGMKALAFEGTLHEQRLRQLVMTYHPDAEIHFAASNDEILERVGAGRQYFAYIDLYNYHRASNRGVAIKRHNVADESEEQFGYLMPLGTSWDEVVERYFTHDGGLTKSQRYRDIMEAHLGKDLARMLTDAGH